MVAVLQHPLHPQDEPRSPFASPMWSRPPGQELGISRSLPMPIRKDSLLHSPSFHARQLSFQDWCFDPAGSAGQQPEKKPKQLPSLPTPTSDLTLKPKVRLQPERSRISRLQWDCYSSISAKKEVQHINDLQENARSQTEGAEIDWEDLLSCKEVLSSSHPLEYELPASKRRRSCYAF